VGPDLSFIARRLRLLALDVDGVLTDNRNIQGIGVDAKVFHVHDKTGIRLCQDRMGLPIALATGRESSATRLFAEEMNITECVVSPDGKKLLDFEALLLRLGVHWHEVAFVGDDIADIPILRRCGLPIAVANAHKGVFAHAKYVTTAKGGDGAVREVIDWLAEIRGEYANAYDYELMLRESPLPASGVIDKGDRLEVQPGHGVDEGVHRAPNDYPTKPELIWWGRPEMGGGLKDVPCCRTEDCLNPPAPDRLFCAGCLTEMNGRETMQDTPAATIADALIQRCIP
jgi:3-deoxy-D-manno-octulosonate 8-phosphate phosphatase (KDO 8-P phosphatase)